jgi:acetolactate decarboxylase
MKIFRWILAVGLFGITAAVHAVSLEPEPQPAEVYQISTLDTLASGEFEGQTSVQSLLEHGDTGLGTFNDLDGEMVVLGGAAYQIKSSGQVAKASPDMKVPFAMVNFFKPGQTLDSSEPRNEKQFMAFLDEHLPTRPHYFLIRVQGEFASVTTRSVPRQSKPYPTLAAVLPQQAVFNLGAGPGILIGFRSPPMQKSASGSGYHFHFLNVNKTAGGHALAYTLRQGKVEIEEIAELHLVLPEAAKNVAPAAGNDPR